MKTRNILLLAGAALIAYYLLKKKKRPISDVAPTKNVSQTDVSTQPVIDRKAFTNNPLDVDLNFSYQSGILPSRVVKDYDASKKATVAPSKVLIFT
jgi:hypothetical protein